MAIPVVDVSDLIGGHVEAVLDASALAVCRAPARRAPHHPLPDGACPVYALGKKGPPAVATGRIFVRFADHVMLEDRKADLQDAGYRIEEVLDFAPHSGWVTAINGGPARSLSSIDRLEGLDGVVVVEPQMLRPVKRR